jgi:hypothetical protein
MDAIEPRVRVVQRFCAPNSFPCPHCGKRGRRVRTHTRPVRDIAYGEVLIIELTVGEYRARCSCCKTFRSQVEGIELRAQYANRVREAVIDRLLDDSMSMERLREALQRDFHLNLSQGFLYDCLDWKVRQVDMPGYRQWTLENFSGTLNLDEIHLGHRTLLLATDPLSDFPVAFALVTANDQEHMRRFLLNLKNLGFVPKVVVTDGSTLYPKVLAELWPDARHQLCVFHVLKDINKLILDAVRRMRTAMGRRGKAGRKKKRGRKGAKSRARAARRGMTLKEKSHFVFKHRHLIVKRRENLSDSERDDLTRMLEYLPELATLRRFADRTYWLFGTPKDFHQAACRRATIARDRAFLDVPELAKAIEQVDEEKFAKLMAYLKNPVSRRVRTNNHVERTNRMFRFLEKVRYKWRRRKTLVRFVVLTLDAILRGWTQAEAKSSHPTKPVRHDTTKVDERQRSRQVA